METVAINDMFLQLGVGGILALLILERVFAFLVKRRNGMDDHALGCRLTGFDGFHQRMDESLKRIERSLEKIKEKL